MTRAASAFILALVVTTAVAAPIPDGQLPAPDVSAPVAYRDLMLVLATKDGVAAVVFDGRGSEGKEIDYSFRHEAKDGRKTTGTGKLFEKRLAEGGYDYGGLIIKAGTASVKWSASNEDRGWIYYSPEVVTVHLAHADNFKDKSYERPRGEPLVVKALDLRRFMKK